MAKGGDSNKLLKFNLIPPISPEEIKALEDRDNTILYSLMLLCGGIFIYVFLTLLQLIVIQPNQTIIEEDIVDLEQAKASNNTIISQNGELFFKTNLIKPVIGQDVKLSEIITIANTLIADSSLITSYEKENEGLIVISFDLPNVETLETIMGNVEQSTEIQEPFLRRLTLDPITGALKAILTFNVTRTTVANG